MKKPISARRLTCCLIFMFFAGNGTVCAQAPATDTPIHKHGKGFRPYILPAALAAYGTLTVSSGPIPGPNEAAHDLIWDGRTHPRPTVEDFTTYVPEAAVYALNLAGYKGRHHLLDYSVILAASHILANGFSFGIKELHIEDRPDGSAPNSFPSGHTTAAFVSAELFYQEYRDRAPWPVLGLGYAVGLSTAYLRMYHNRHWLSDVAAGAGIGMASTKLIYYLYPKMKTLLVSRRILPADAMLMPVVHPDGLGFAAAFRIRSKSERR